MKISECMTSNPRIVGPEQPVQEAARLMDDMDVGFLPVGQNGRLLGVITDRDITVRAVGQGLGNDALVRDVMTHDIRFCRDDDDVATVLADMGGLQIRRMPVVSQDQQLAGVVSLGDLSRTSAQTETANALREISRDPLAENQLQHNL